MPRKIRREWIDKKTGSYYIEYEPLDAPGPVAPEPEETGVELALAAYQQRFDEAWAEFRRVRCDCDECREAHRAKPGVSRGHGCGVGETGWWKLQATLKDIKQKELPHGHPAAFQKGCRCEACADAARTPRPMVGGKVSPAGEARAAELSTLLRRQTAELDEMLAGRYETDPNAWDEDY